MSRDEVNAILGLNLATSRIYQESKAEGKAEGKAEILAVTVPLLLNAGMTVEQIAQETGIEIEVIRGLVN